MGESYKRRCEEIVNLKEKCKEFEDEIRHLGQSVEADTELEKMGCTQLTNVEWRNKILQLVSRTRVM